MEFLLKIVDGPMKGAEIALVEGVTASFGSGEDCDIVVHDSTVPAKACEFEVDASGVRITTGGGSAETLPSFEIRSFGTTSFAVGPVSGEWQDLIKPARPQLERPDAAEPSAPVAPVANETPTPTPTPRRHGLLACCALAVVLLVGLAVAAWFFWTQGGDALPTGMGERDATSWAGRPRPAPLTLSDIARQHGLTLTGRTISGNLRRRTERLAIRALALAADPNTKFDLTDDETLMSSSSELIFAVSDGALKVIAASNRVVTLAGYAPSSAALERALRALDADVKGVDRVDTVLVKVGGSAPSSLAKTPFVREQPPGEHPVVAIPAHTPNPPAEKADSRSFPIAGILTAPYPCVVMRNGLRLVEGAQIGKAVLVKIEADRLTLDDGGRKVEWRP